MQDHDHKFLLYYHHQMDVCVYSNERGQSRALLLLSTMFVDAKLQQQ